MAPAASGAHRDGPRVGVSGMPLLLQAYTAEGLVRGSILPQGGLGDLLEALDSIIVEASVMTPLDGRPDVREPRAEIATDDLLVVVAPPSTPAPVHASWHDLVLTVGPYRVEGLLPTLPGFDPGRALARPGGTFVLLGSARVSLAADPAAGGVEHPLAWVNRYAVESVEADLDLGIFFPGARSVVGHGAAPRATAGRPGPEVGTSA